MKCNCMKKPKKRLIISNLTDRLSKKSFKLILIKIRKKFKSLIKYLGNTGIHWYVLWLEQVWYCILDLEAFWPFWPSMLGKGSSAHDLIGLRCGLLLKWNRFQMRVRQAKNHWDKRLPALMHYEQSAYGDSCFWHF